METIKQAAPAKRNTEYWLFLREDPRVGNPNKLKRYLPHQPTWVTSITHPTLQNDTRPFIPLTINNKNFEALIDTGGTVLTFISQVLTIVSQPVAENKQLWR